MTTAVAASAYRGQWTERSAHRAGQASLWVARAKDKPQASIRRSCVGAHGRILRGFAIL